MALWKSRKRAEDALAATVGLIVGPTEACVVYCEGEDGGRPRIVAWESIPYHTAGELQAGVSGFVDRHELHGHACRCTLSTDDYSLRLVERPANVPDEDLVDATRWLVRDLIEFDVENAEIAILTLPDGHSRGRTPHMFVVAARREAVLDLAHVADAAGLRLLGFEIVESTMIALDAGMPALVAGNAMVRIDDKSSVLTIGHDGYLYLARNLHVELDALDHAAQAALEAADPTSLSITELIDPLLLDIQRSLDYYESEYGQAPASRLTLLPAAVDVTPLVPALAEALRPIQVEPFEIERYFAFASPPPPDLHQALTLAAGSTVARPTLIGDALLPASFKPIEGGFGLGSVARITSAIMALLAVFYAVTLYQLDRGLDALAALDLRRDTLIEQIDDGNDRALAAAQATDPEAEIAALVAERDARVKMLSDMTQRGSNRDASFSHLLAGLARQDLEAIWLQRIAFSQGGGAITLEGRALDPEAIPEYLRRLGRESGFASRRFRTFAVDRGDGSEQGLRFRLASSLEGAGSVDAEDEAPRGSGRGAVR